MMYHHCRDLESIIFGEVIGNPEYSDPDFKPAYLWLEKEVGFYPLFLAVGEYEEDIRMTGYQNQFEKTRKGVLYKSLKNSREVETKPPSNLVLFSFQELDGIFMDYQYWHIALNASINGYDVTKYEKGLIFKPSWKASRWLRMAKQRPHSVQLATPRIYLPEARRIWVRNKKTGKILEDMGFENIEVRRIKADKF